MRILVSGAAGSLAAAIVAELGDAHHQLRLFDTDAGAVDADADADAVEGVEVVQGDLTDAESAWRAVRGMDAVVHTGEPPPLPATPEHADWCAVLDRATRGTHVLCKAAVDAGVKRIVYCSTLEVFADYPEDVYISELFKPLPPPDMPVMSRYLGELVCREFARDFPITATSLRLGRLVVEDDVAGQRPDTMWLDRRDAAQAVVQALDRDRSTDMRFTSRWAVYHICADIPNPRYLIDTATRTLGYKPQHNFDEHWPDAGHERR